MTNSIAEFSVLVVSLTVAGSVSEASEFLSEAFLVKFMAVYVPVSETVLK